MKELKPCDNCGSPTPFDELKMACSPEFEEILLFDELGSSMDVCKKCWLLEGTAEGM
tara:strand:+ start:3290 stop:3460 length:171 start_codon:yes stop_codon:yes gene_type:complete